MNNLHLQAILFFFNFFFFEVSGIHPPYKGKILRLLQEIFLVTELGKALIQVFDIAVKKSMTTMRGKYISIYEGS